MNLAKTFLLAATGLALATASPLRAAVTVTNDTGGPAGQYRILVNGDTADDFCTVELSYSVRFPVAVGGGRAHSAADGDLNIAVYQGQGQFSNITALPIYTDYIAVPFGESMEIDLMAGQDQLVIEKEDPASRPVAKARDLHFHALLLSMGQALFRDGTNGVDNMPAGVLDTIACANTEVVYYYGEPGPQGNRNAGDQVWMYDSAGNDGVLCQRDFSYITNGDLSHFRYCESVPVVYIYSQSGGRDYCVHNLDVAGGGPEACVFSGTAFSYGSGAFGTFTYFNVCAGFPINYGFSLNADDLAYYIDSPGNDVYYGGNNPAGAYSYMSGPHSSGQGFFNASRGFPLCYAQSFVSPSDFDTAVINHAPSNVIVGFNSVINQ